MRVIYPGRGDVLCFKTYHNNILLSATVRDRSGLLAFDRSQTPRRSQLRSPRRTRCIVIILYYCTYKNVYSDE